MPGTYAHLMITDEALREFSTDPAVDRVLRGVALTHSQYIQLGSVSPDYPYLDLLQPEQKCWGDHMHYRRTGDAVKSMAAELMQGGSSRFQEEEFVIPLCWTMGYLSHVTADLVVHPVVFNIVGPYQGNETEHRHCEMIQDSFIYNKIRRGAEIRHNQLMEIIQTCSDPDDPQRIHPFLNDFWADVLLALFPADSEETPPEIDQWHCQFEDWIGLAGDPLFVGRIVDPNHKFTYKKSSEITSKEKKRYLEAVPLPGGRIGRYDRDVFPKAVEALREKWTVLAHGLSRNNLDEFSALVTDCDLDTGKDLQNSKLVYW